MTGLDGRRVYLDWNASAPLRSEARDAMLSAMDALGNPSSVHAEGRKAKAILERARAQVADLVGCEQSEVVFTSGATEAASLALSSRTVIASDVEHDCIHAHRSKDAGIPLVHGRLDYACKASVSHGLSNADDVVLAFQAANSETGVVHDFAGAVAHYDAALFFRLFVDLAQTAGRIPLTYRHDGQSSDTCWRPLFSVISGHKFGSSPGVGALIVDTGYAEHEDVEIGAMSVGGGQER
ncbi:MAG: aminotransferase class V-fold PLP-dependent enzyme, partial [Pseudomonadota bacterium]